MNTKASHIGFKACNQRTSSLGMFSKTHMHPLIGSKQCPFVGKYFQNVV